MQDSQCVLGAGNGPDHLQSRVIANQVLQQFTHNLRILDDQDADLVHKSFETVGVRGSRTTDGIITGLAGQPSIVLGDRSGV